jgi:hypothetical protein
LTIDDLIRTAGQHGWLLLAFFVTPPLLTACIGVVHRTPERGAGAPYRHLYCGIIYSVTFPGMMAAALTGYGMFFLRADLRSVPILLYFLPIVSMVSTWALMRRQVDLDSVPGFQRLSALMFGMALCFGLAFAVNRLFFGVLFLGSLWGLLIVAVAIFVVFRTTFRRVSSD